jgi:large subunit ribosomal protein L4
MNRKVRQLALRSALSEKCRNSDLTLIDNLTFDEIKTKKAVALLDAFNFDRKTLFVADASEDFDNAYVSMRNIPNAMLVTVAGLNVYDIVNADKIVFTEAAAAKAGEVFA